MIQLKDVTICDLIPDVLKNEPKVMALSYVVHNLTEQLIELADKVLIYPNIDNQDDDVLDELAIELQTQHYNQTYDTETKRELIKNTLQWYMHAGTRAAVDEFVQSIYGVGTRITEWFENSTDGLNPYEFSIQTDQQITSDMLQETSRYIEYIKNARSHLKTVGYKGMMQLNGYQAIVMNLRSQYMKREVDLSSVKEA